MTAIAAEPRGQRDVGNVNEVVLQHLTLCQSAARRFHRVYNELDDLVQVARLGMIKAAERHDAALGPFRPYAWQTMIGDLCHYVRDYEAIVRPPRSATREQRAALTQYSPLPTDDDVMRAVVGVHEPGFSSLWLREALTRLPHRQRIIVLGVVVSGYTQEEVGAALGLSQTSVSKLMRKALRWLQVEASL